MKYKLDFKKYRKSDVEKYKNILNKILQSVGTSWHQLAPVGTSWHQLVCGNVAWFGMVGRKSQHQLASTSWLAPVGTSWH